MTIDDISQPHQAFGLLQSADQQKNEFLAMLAHELRNPLAAIQNGLQIWARGDAGEETENVARIGAQRQLEYQIRLVEDLLDVSRIARGIVKLKMARLDLAETVKRAVDGMRVEIEAHRHNVTLVLPPEPLTVEADAMRIEKIVTNLLGNAIKYTPPGGHIEVSLEWNGNAAVLAVADNGIGMESEFMPTIFTIFVQADRSLDRAAGGLGLGLAMVHHLVELHSGNVRAFSEGLGHGSKFVVRLPALPQGTVLPSSATLDERTAPPTCRRRILVVDDDADSAASSAILLRLDGHEVEIACDGPSALQSAQDFRPDVVLLDIGLPGTDGYEVARRLRAIPDQAKTLLIAHSGYGQEENLERARQAGFDHHLVKPADLRKLKNLIAAHNKPLPVDDTP